jgi:[protein-PII] uridylyltransferase
MPSSLVSFLELRSAVRTQRIGDGGRDTVAALTAGLDSALQELAADVGSDTAVVALGGYGRGEQCLWSDVDVMVLHRRDDPEPLVRQVLYPLWDADLKVGHAVRTVAESREAGQDEFDTLTSLLSARLIGGDEALFQELMATVTELVRKRPLASRLVERERQRRLRDPYPTMAADIKEGRGALRTHHGFWWERRRAELLGIAAADAGPVETNAQATLLRVRNALHAAAGRASDRFLVDLRQPAAEWLGTDVDALAAELTAALHAGDLLADQRWPDMHAEQDPMIGLGRRVFGSIRSRFSAGEERPAEESGVLGMAVRAAARLNGARLDRREEDFIRQSPPLPWTFADRTSLVTLLSGGARGRAVFGQLEDLGWVDQHFPEWLPVATAPQLAPFHDHPVGAHLWRAADEMHALIKSGGETGAIADEVGSTEELLLAAFLHDIGKARGGDHAEVGAGVAAGFLRRAGFGPATVGVVVTAVRLHLLLSETATRRDIADPEVIDEVAAQVGDLRQLQILYLLTIADLRATGTTMWNDWRASLIHSLFGRVGEAIESGAAPPATADIEAILECADGDVTRRTVEEHVTAMPPDYLATTTPREILWHIGVVKKMREPALVAVDPIDPGRVLVVGDDRSGFLLAVSRAFVANGVSIMDARLRTRADGIALDTFHVCEDRTGGVVGSAKWEAVTKALQSSLAGQLDLRSAIRERVEAYRRADHDSAAVELRSGVDGRYAAVEVRMPDRVGLLTDIVEAIHGEGLDIHLAKIDTMGDVARDIFYIRRIGGAPIRSDTELEALCARLADRLRG